MSDTADGQPGRLERPVVIHPGFHKTGTTFLQNRVFSDERVFRPLWSHGEIDRFVIRPHDLDFSPLPGREDIAVRRSGARAEILDIVSSETLCGQPFTGSREAVMQARRLKAVFGEAKIVFTVRKQASILRAIYIQYLTMGGLLSPEAFFDRKARYGYFAFDLHVFEFHKLVEFYGELFGDGNILVLTQEELQRDLDDFVRRLRAFGGVPAGAPPSSIGDKGRDAVSPPPSGIPLMRLANRFRTVAVNAESPARLALLGELLVKVAYRQTWFFRGEAARLDAAIASRFSGLFASSNERLQQFAPADLRALGYEMPAP
jgi:hypothetical protein